MTLKEIEKIIRMVQKEVDKKNEHRLNIMMKEINRHFRIIFDQFEKNKNML